MLFFATITMKYTDENFFRNITKSIFTNKEAYYATPGLSVDLHTFVSASACDYEGAHHLYSPSPPLYCVYLVLR